MNQAAVALKHCFLKLFAFILIVVAGPLQAQSEPKESGSKVERQAQRQENQRRPKRDLAMVQQPADVAALNELSVILGRPTAEKVTANVLAKEPLECFIEYGTQTEVLNQRTPNAKLNANIPVELELSRLIAGTQYFYRLRFRKSGELSFAAGAQFQFHTQRKPGQTFTFEIQGDSHPERPQQFDPALYAQTLRAAAKDRPDFYMTIGDDFSVDTLDNVTAQTVSQRYLLQRPYLALVGQTAPLFLVNGNHEQAAGVNLDGSPENVAVWAQRARNSYYSLPATDNFYSGNDKEVEHIGLLRDYYGWTWGDALFLVIDPYWHSKSAVDNVFGKRDKGDRNLMNATQGFRDMWNITLGDKQYQWFKKELESSKARYKFVFAHHVLGTGRGGVEQAQLFEWGGKDKRGEDSFVAHRPGWDLPIHQLMVKHGVTAFFQGHDHVFAYQELDGVVYQTLPQPADPNYALNYSDAYRSGKIIPSSGRVRVTVGTEKVAVEYVRSYLQSDSPNSSPTNEGSYSYQILGK